MPRYYKRRYRKRSRTLNKTNVAMKTSAKSQARQIMALNRKISYVYRQTKPETSITQYTARDVEYAQGTVNTGWTGVIEWVTNTAGSAYADGILPPLGTVVYNTATTGTNSPPNNFCRLK